MYHYGPLWSIFALHYIHIVYITALFPRCISSATVFPISTIFSPSFFCFSSSIFFSISIYCGFTFFYHYAALVVPFCTWLFFSLFFRTFDVETSFLPWKNLCFQSFFCILSVAATNCAGWKSRFCDRGRALPCKHRWRVL